MAYVNVISQQQCCCPCMLTLLQPDLLHSNRTAGDMDGDCMEMTVEGN